MHCEALLGLAWLFHLLVLSQCVCDYETSNASTTSGHWWDLPAAGLWLQMITWWHRVYRLDGGSSSEHSFTYALLSFICFLAYCVPLQTNGVRTPSVQKHPAGWRIKACANLSEAFFERERDISRCSTGEATFETWPKAQHETFTKIFYVP